MDAAAFQSVPPAVDAPSSPPVLVAPDPSRIDELAELLAVTFMAADLDAGRRLMQDHLRHNPDYDWKTSRIGLINDRIVTHFGVKRVTMRIGACSLPVAGVAAVATHPERRKRGLMQATADAALAAMRPAGYALSFLFGIDGYYDRFRYVPAWGNTDAVVRTNALPAEIPPETAVTTFAEIFPPAADQLYNETYAGVTGTAVRPSHGGRLDAREALAGHVLTRDGRPRAYVLTAAPADPLRIVDAAGDGDDVLALAAMLARQAQATAVRFAGIPLRGPIAARLRRGNCRFDNEWRANGGPMIRIVDLRACLDQLAGKLSARLRASAARHWTGLLQLGDGVQAATLDIAAGRVCLGATGRTEHRLDGGPALAQLLIGTDGPEQIMRRREMSATGDAAALAAVLFPHQHPQLGVPDRF